MPPAVAAGSGRWRGLAVALWEREGREEMGRVGRMLRVEERGRGEE